ncbi:MAG: 2-oxoglutarate dehydrogenase complex dihydrolipoyllysine-residue succinyltransferase [Sulfuricellaceae bacterium]
MQFEVKVPALSESVSEATLLTWHKKAGETVKRGENLIDIETDKVVLELPAPQDGVLSAIIKGDGSLVVGGEAIAMIDNAIRSPEPAAVDSNAVQHALSPAARKLAVENTVDAAKIAGSGRDGRVTKGDVLAAIQPIPEPSGTPHLTLSTDSPPRPEQRVPMTRLRARIAERLVQSQQTAAILTTFNELNMAPVMALRNRHKERFEKEHGVKLGFMSFFVKAAVNALKKFPVVNASVDGNDIVYHGYFDIGIAVGSPRGLVVPILRDADRLSFADIERTIADFGTKAKDGKLTLEALTGGTFSITNGGVFGSMMSTPIINPPQSAILGMHATKERPVAENGQVVIRPMMYLALSYDHRIIDGRDAVLTLVEIKEALEDPARLLLEL